MPDRKAKEIAVAEAAKKAAKQPATKQAEPQQTYRVISDAPRPVLRHRLRAESHEDEVVGRYASYNKARAKVAKYLVDQYGRDYFDEYTESEEGDVSGDYEIYALCPEGEEMWVFVEAEGPLDDSSSESEPADEDDNAEDDEGSDALEDL
ncbi:uncharacterized protein LOC62_03G004949 [Vanrija pseudolonga]|uniref:Uncharacterized protein n=1 Tax=Vanrija pseudolonga TaxID=143232 RepID=A0AAF0YB55_9TREE|nr:hypothetical protein LOC62_03G004949 [Vanrija pseudolonga]